MLLGIFATLLAGIALVGGGVFILRHYLELRDEITLLRDRLGSMNLAISQGAEWAERSAWLDDNVPAFTSNKDASAKLLEKVSQAAQAQALTIGSTELLEAARAIGADGLPLEAEAEARFDKAAIKIVVTGAQESAFFAWLHELQRPEGFIGVTRLQINPSGTDKAINAEVEFTQYYRERPAPKITKNPAQ